MLYLSCIADLNDSAGALDRISQRRKFTDCGRNRLRLPEEAYVELGYNAERALRAYQ